MIRKVSFRKAILAGAIGAVLWELAVRALLVAGVRGFDIVHLLGTLFLPDAPATIWWPVGLLLHALVGAIWAIFYAYFFWANYPWRPAVQGLAFSLVPAFLAGLLMVPQLGAMHPTAPKLGLFATEALGYLGPAAILAGHLLWGLATGALYTRPVGYATPKNVVVIHA